MSLCGFVCFNLQPLAQFTNCMVAHRAQMGSGALQVEVPPRLGTRECGEVILRMVRVNSGVVGVFSSPEMLCGMPSGKQEAGG